MPVTFDMKLSFYDETAAAQFRYLQPPHTYKGSDYMSNSSLVSYTKISPYQNSRNGKKIDTITIHCAVGHCSVEGLGSVFQTKRASANYGIGWDGRVGLYVDENKRSWATSSSTNDRRAVTIECACDPTHPYAVNTKVYNTLIKLVVDICQRNGIKKLVWSTSKSDRMNHKNGCNMTVHRDYEAKACPGKYLYDLHGQIAAEVNKKLKGGETVVASTKEAKTVKIELPVLRNGSSGAAVKAVQRMLRTLGYVNIDGKAYISVDGSYGSNTEAAVKRYQKARGAKSPDGIVGEWTWNQLLNGK